MVNPQRSYSYPYILPGFSLFSTYQNHPQLQPKKFTKDNRVFKVIFDIINSISFCLLYILYLIFLSLFLVTKWSKLFRKALEVQRIGQNKLSCVAPPMHMELVEQQKMHPYENCRCIEWGFDDYSERNINNGQLNSLWIQWIWETMVGMVKIDNKTCSGIQWGERLAIASNGGSIVWR